MKYALFFASSGAAVTWYAFQGPPLSILLLWPAASLATVAAGYAGLGAQVFGKRRDGRLAVTSALVLAPYLLLTELVWHLSRLLRREVAYNLLAPGFTIGRRLLGSEYPEEFRAVVDLTAEFQDPMASRADRTYLTLPILDGHVPSADALMDLVFKLQTRSDGVYIHCAEGHGRTALVAAALLLGSGQARSLEEAVGRVLDARPLAHMNRTQARFLGSLIAEGILGDARE